MRDVTDINHPTTVGAVNIPSTPGFADPTSFRFASPSELSYVNPDGNLVRFAFGSSSGRVVATCVGSYDWGHQGTSLVYTSQSDSRMAIHQLASGIDRVLGYVPSVPAVGCETVAGCSGTDSWQVGLSYSPDGSLILFVENIANVNVFRLWASDGTLLKSTDSQSPTMTAWSGGSLYYLAGSGVVVWRAGITSAFLPSLAWIWPRPSMGGSQIVYETRDVQGWHHVNIVDTSTKVIQVLNKSRDYATFLTPRYLWYMGERACGAQEGCDATHSATLSGKTYIYDLQGGTETESIITSVADVWPHAG